MQRCDVCGGNRVKISGMSVRRMFTVRCLRKECGATIVRDMSISAALAGVLTKPQRNPSIARSNSDRMSMWDGEE
jgi:hypothetical protein